MDHPTKTKKVLKSGQSTVVRFTEEHAQRYMHAGYFMGSFFIGYSVVLDTLLTLYS